VKDLPKVPTWWLEWDSKLQPSGREAPNIPLSPTRHAVKTIAVKAVAQERSIEALPPGCGPCWNNKGTMVPLNSHTAFIRISKLSAPWAFNYRAFFGFLVESWEICSSRLGNATLRLGEFILRPGDSIPRLGNSTARFGTSLPKDWKFTSQCFWIHSQRLENSLLKIRKFTPHHSLEIHSPGNTNSLPQALKFHLKACNFWKLNPKAWKFNQKAPKFTPQGFQIQFPRLWNSLPNEL